MKRPTQDVARELELVALYFPKAAGWINRQAEQLTELETVQAQLEAAEEVKKRQARVIASIAGFVNNGRFPDRSDAELVARTDEEEASSVLMDVAVLKGAARVRAELASFFREEVTV